MAALPCCGRDFIGATCARSSFGRLPGHQHLLRRCKGEGKWGWGTPIAELKVLAKEALLWVQGKLDVGSKDHSSYPEGQ